MRHHRMWLITMIGSLIPQVKRVPTYHIQPLIVLAVGLLNISIRHLVLLPPLGIDSIKREARNQVCHHIVLPYTITSTRKDLAVPLMAAVVLYQTIVPSKSLTNLSSKAQLNAKHSRSLANNSGKRRMSLGYLLLVILH